MNDSTQPQVSCRAEILNFLPDQLKISPEDPINNVGTSVLRMLKTRPAAARELAHKKLHAFPFRQVPQSWLRALEEACLWEIVYECRNVAEPDKTPSTLSFTYGGGCDFPRRVVHLCDVAIIFAGAQRRRRAIDQVLAIMERCFETTGRDNDTSIALRESGTELGPPKKKARREVFLRSSNESLLESHTVTPQTEAKFPSTTGKAMPSVDQDAHGVQRIDQPSLTSFERHLNTLHTPLVVQNSIDNWPARQRWKRPAYWLSRTHQGRRLVPVELGTSYTDSEWGQSIMEFGTFLKNHLMDHPGEHDHRLGYLAQHDLLTQIPALRNDLLVPDYCYAETNTPDTSKTAFPADGDASSLTDDGDAEEDFSTTSLQGPMLNIWLGPGNTVSPAHTDPHENILAQVMGRKYIRLFPPEEVSRMYPTGLSQNENSEQGSSEAIDMQNTSQVDVAAFMHHVGEDKTVFEERHALAMTKFPLHAQAKYFETVLNEGECLYIPRGWWHYIESLEVSCSVSFWWD